MYFVFLYFFPPKNQYKQHLKKIVSAMTDRRDFWNIFLTMFFKNAYFFIRKWEKNVQKLQYCDKKTPKLDDVKDKDEKLQDMKNPTEKNVLRLIAIEKTQEVSNKCKLAKECDSIIVGKKILIKGSNFHLVQLMIDSKIPLKSVQNVDKSSEIPKLRTKVDGGGSGVVARPGPVRQQPGKVLWGFIPFEWAELFHPKTGVTGFYTFLLTLATFLISKEHYVLEHNFYNGLSFAIMWIYGIKKFGPRIATFLDTQIDNYEKELNESRRHDVENVHEAIKNEEHNQFQMDGQLMLIEAKRENVQLQLEAEFRNRQMHVYNTIKNILDYHIAAQQIWRRIQIKNLVEYVKREVVKSVTPDLEKACLDFSIEAIIDEFKRQNKLI